MNIIYNKNKYKKWKFLLLTALVVLAIFSISNSAYSEDYSIKHGFFTSGSSISGSNNDYKLRNATIGQMVTHFWNSDGSLHCSLSSAYILNMLINNSPIITKTDGFHLDDINEDSIHNIGNTILQIIQSTDVPQITDIDIDDQKGIAVIGVTNRNGNWQYSIDSGNSFNDFVDLSEKTALLFDAQNNNYKIRFLSHENYSGNDTGNILFKAWDISRGISGSSGVDTTGNDGTLPFSLETGIITVNVNPINDIPNISPLNNVFTNENTNTEPVIFQISDIDNNINELLLIAQSSNKELVPENESNLIFSGTDSKRSLVIKPANEKSGTCQITITVNDGNGGYNHSSFTLTVNAIPDISQINDQIIDYNTSVQNLLFTIFDSETPSNDLIIKAFSSNNLFIPDSNILISGTGNDRYLNITPEKNQSGNAAITIQVSDSHYTSTTSFELTVKPPDGAPEISDISDKQTNEDTLIENISFQVSDNETPANELIITANSSNQKLVKNEYIYLSGNDENRSISIMPENNESGTVIITISASDNKNIVTKSFKLNIIPVNDQPEISDISNIDTFEDTPISPVYFTVSDPETNAENLILNAKSLDESKILSSNIRISGDTNQKILNLSPQKDQNGIVNIVVSVSDGTYTQTKSFSVNIKEVNDLPVADAGQDQSVEEGNIVVLNGDKSYDIETIISSYKWKQTEGPSVILSSPDSKTLTFLAQDIDIDKITLTFELTVSDTEGLTSTDTVIVTIQNIVKYYTIISTISEGGEIIPSGNIQVAENSDKTFTIKALDNFYIKDVRINGNSIGSKNEYTFYDLIEDSSISVIFEQRPVIYASSGENGNIFPAGDVMVKDLSSEFFKFTPDNGYRIKDVLIDNISIGSKSSYYFRNINKDHTIQVFFKPINPIVKVISNDNGTINPSGDVQVIEGNSISFKITPDEGHWIKDITIDGASIGNVSSHTVQSVYESFTIAAYFEPLPQYTITVATSEGGKISPSQKQFVTHGDSIDFKIIPENEYEILNIGIDGILKNPVSTYSFVSVDQNHSITASFIAKPVLYIAESDNGTISPTGNIVVNRNSSIMLEIISDKNYEIEDIIVDGDSNGPHDIFPLINITKDHNINAVFKQKPSITATSGIGGLIEPAGITYVNSGESITYNIIPESDYKIKEVLVNNVSLGKINNYPFINVIENQTIQANFQSILYSITITSNYGGDITPSETTIVRESDDYNFSCKPYSTYEIKDVLVDGKSIGKTQSHTLWSITKNHTIFVEFLQKPTIESNSSDNGSIEPKGTIYVNTASSKEFHINPNDGYIIKDVLVDGKAIGTENVFIFEDIKESHTIFANFEKPAITATSDDNGEIIPSGTNQYLANNDITYTISPSKGYTISDILVNNQSIGILDSYTFWDINSNNTIHASFKSLPKYTIESGVSTGGSITPSGIFEVYQGQSIDFDFLADDSYELDYLEINGNNVKQSENYYYLKNINKNYDIKVYFKEIPKTIFILEAGNGGEINPKGTIELLKGQSQTVNIKSLENYKLEDVIIDGISQGPVNSMIINADSYNSYSEHRLEASFTEIINRKIKGRVTASEDVNKGISGYIVEVWEISQVRGSATTDQNGYYTISNLLNIKNLYVSVWPPSDQEEYLGQFYGGFENWDQAYTVTTWDGDAENINFSLDKKSANGISGKIHDGVNGIKDITVEIYSEKTGVNRSEISDESGFYTIIGLKESDDYIVYVYSDDYKSDFYYKIPENETPGLYIPEISTMLSTEATRFKPEDPVLTNIDIIVNIGGTIKGTVYKSDGTALPDIWVNARSIGISSAKGALSDENGNYTIFGLKEVLPSEADINGYIVEIIADGFAYQAYDKSFNENQSTYVPTQSENIDFYLHSTSNISGLILNPEGKEVSNAKVLAWSLNDPAVKSSSTISDLNGNYTISNLPISNDYIVSVESNYPVMYYDNQKNKSNASLVDITYGDRKNINFTLDKGFIIKGNIYIENSQTKPSSSILVMICSKSNSKSFYVNTDNDGYYEVWGLNQNTSDYIISIDDSNYLSAYYRDNLDSDLMNDTVYSYSEAVGITPGTSNDDILRNLILIKGVTLKGKVLYKDNPLSNVLITAKSNDGGWGTATSTSDNNYNYTITGIKPGQYEIEYSIENFDTIKSSISINQQVNILDDIVFEAPDKQISGTIINCDNNDTLNIHLFSSSISYNKTIEKKCNGSLLDFQFLRLQKAQDYMIELLSDNYKYNAYDNKSDWMNADKIDITNSNYNNVIFKLEKIQKTCSVSGNINFPSSADSLDEIEIRLYSETSNTLKTKTIIYEGTEIVPFSIENFQKFDDYIISISSDTFINQYYNNVDDLDDAEYLNFSNSNSITGVNFVLSKGAQIYGKVTNSINEPLKNIQVEVISPSSLHFASTTTSDNGIYTIAGLQIMDDYILSINDSDYGLFYYNENKMVGEKSLASKINTTINNSINIDLKMIKIDSIVGKILDSNSNPLEKIWVSAWSEIQKAGNGTFSDNSGVFEIKGLPEGIDYTVSALPDKSLGFLDQKQMNVKTGSDSIVIRLQKLDGNTLSGLVVDNQNNPVKNVRVEIESASDTSLFYFTKTNEAGQYTINMIVSKGDYSLKAWPEKDSIYALYTQRGFVIDSDIKYNITMIPGLIISGTVYKNGKEKQNIKITAFSNETGFYGEAVSDKDGFYEIENVPNSSDYVISAKSNSSETNEKIIEQSIKSLSPGTGINFYIETAGTITGEVVSSITGSPIDNVRIEVYSMSRKSISDYGAQAFTNKKGKYNLSGIKKTDQNNSVINDYVLTAYADGYASQSKAGKKTGDKVDFILSPSKNSLTGLIENIDSRVCVKIFVADGSYLKTINADENGSFTANALSSLNNYQLKFVRLVNSVENHQWASQGTETYDIGISDTIDGKAPSNAKKYTANAKIIFRFSNNKKIKKYYTNNGPGPVNNLHSTSHVYKLMNKKLRSDSNLQPTTDQISNNPNIIVKWDPPETNSANVSGYYQTFGTAPDHTFDTFNITGQTPVKTRKLTSEDLAGDDLSYYFHVAPIDKEGRLGPTTSIAFRIDTVPPTNVSVSAPDETQNLNIDLILGATGAAEMYISNISYKEGGIWENKISDKKWKINTGSGKKNIYVRYRDRAENTANVMGKTFYNQTNPVYTINATASENGSISPSGYLDLEKSSNISFNVSPDNGYIVDKFIVNNIAKDLNNNQYKIENLSENHNISVSFKKAVFKVRLQAGTNGSINPVGEIEAVKNSSLNININPDSGYEINSFSLDLKVIPVVNNQYTIENVEKNHSVYVTFVRVFQLSFMSGDNGTISILNEKSRALESSTKVSAGSAKTIIVSPEPGYIVDVFTVDGIPVELDGNKYTFLNVDKDHVVDASFKRIEYTVSSESGINGKILPSGNQKVFEGQEITFELTPDDGYTIEKLLVDGVNVAVIDNKYVLSNINQNHSVVATFRLPKYKITASTDLNGYISPSGDIIVERGVNKTFIINPSSGYLVDTILIDNNQVDIFDNQYTFSNIDADHTIHASFKKVYKVTIIAGANGNLDPVGENIVSKGQNLKININPDQGFMPDTITIDSKTYSIKENFYEINNIESDLSVIVKFKEQEFVISATAASNGSIVPSGDIILKRGQNKTFTINPLKGFQIYEIFIDDIKQENITELYTFSNISENRKIHVNFTGFNNAPEVNDLIITTDEDKSVAGFLNAFDQDGDSLSYTIVSNPKKGAVESFNNQTGNFTFSPNPDINGSDSFSFMVNDGSDNSNIASVNITIIPVNDSPVALSKSITILEDQTMSYSFVVSDVENDPLKFIIVNNGLYGKAVIPDSTKPVFSYIPDTNKNGNDSFTYIVNDSKENSELATISVNIIPVNDEPSAKNLNISTPVNQPVSISLTANDIDSNNLKFTIIDNPEYGKISISDNFVNYTPDEFYKGSDSFTYRVNDGLIDSNTATVKIRVGNADIVTQEDIAIDFKIPELAQIAKEPVHGTLTGMPPDMNYAPYKDYYGDDSLFYILDNQEQTLTIEVEPVNDEPEIINPSPIMINEDESIDFTITVIDVDSLDQISFINTQPENGLITGNGPKFTYYPKADYYGDDSFILKVNDGYVTIQDTIRISIKPINDIPVITNNTSIKISEDMPVDITLSAFDPDTNDNLKFNYFSPQNGSISGQAPFITYIPADDYFGFDTFNFTVNDGTADSEPFTITIIIEPVNDAPVSIPISITTNEDIQVSGVFKSIDIDDETLSYSINTQGSKGRIEISSQDSSKFIYIPNQDESGYDYIKFITSDGKSDSYPATITVYINAQNDAPFADNDTISLDEDNEYTGKLNASDIDSEDLYYSIINVASKGSVRILDHENGTFSYIPDNNENGQDLFTFQASDGEETSNTATISINIKPVNDPPKTSDLSFTTDEDTIYTLTLSAIDPDSYSFTYEIINQTQKGTLVFNPLVGNYIYQPDINETGIDTFEFKANDGYLDSNSSIAQINISPVNDPPEASDSNVTTKEDITLNSSFIAQDIDNDLLNPIIVDQPTKGRVELSNNSLNFTYYPFSNESGNDSFSFKISDTELNSSVKKVFITIEPVNDPPEAFSQELNTENECIEITLTANDIDSDDLTFILKSQPLMGTITKTGSNINYCPYSGKFGIDYFNFVVSDDLSQSNQASITIRVGIPPDAHIMTLEDSPVNIQNALHITDNNKTIIIVSQPAHGILSETTSGLIYTPDNNYNGYDNFIYKFEGSFIEQELIIFIKPVNDIPVITKIDTLFIDEDCEPVNIKLIAYDPDNEVIEYKIIEYPLKGNLTVQENNVIYSPLENISGFDSFKFQVKDQFVNVESTVNIIIKPVNDIPVAYNINTQTMEEKQINIQLNYSDSDNLSEEIQYIIIDEPQNGNISISSNKCTYTPNPDFYGDDSFSYKVNDGLNDSNIAYVNIYVRNINDPPVAYPLSFDAEQGKTVTQSLNAVDPDPDNLFFIITRYPTQGQLVLKNPVEGTFMYTADDDLTSNKDYFEFKVSDNKLESQIVRVYINLIYEDEPDQDNTPPEITLTGQNPISIEITSPFDFTYGISAYDKVDGDLTDKITITGNLNTAVLGTYYLYYNVSDNSGNNAQQKVRTIEVINGKGRIIGNVKNISDLASYIPYPSKDIMVELLSSVDKKLIRKKYINNDGSFIFGNLNWQSMYVKFTVQSSEITNQGYISTSSFEKIALNQDVLEKDFYLPELLPFDSSIHLIVNIDGLTNNDEYEYFIINSETGNIIRNKTSNTIQFSEDLKKGTYRLLIIANGYAPFEYRNIITKSSIIDLNSATNPAITAKLVKLAAFDINARQIDISKTDFENGFYLWFIKKNFIDTDNILITILTQDGEKEVKDYIGYGTSNEPYMYTWNYKQDFNSNVTDNQTLYYIDFKFYAVHENEKILVNSTTFKYELTNQHARSGISTDKDIVESKYQQKVNFETIAEKEFYPLAGTSFNVIIKDSNNSVKTLLVNIPKIPLDYLYKDDYQTTNNIGYNAVSDYYNINLNNFNPINPDELITARLNYYKFAGKSLGDALSLSFIHKDKYNNETILRYNPIINKETDRDTSAPKITLPILINPEAELYQDLKQISESEKLFSIIKNERGDGTNAFVYEEVPKYVENNGIVLIDIHHLTLYGIDKPYSKPSNEPETGSAIDNKESDDSGMCFINSINFKIHQIFTFILLIFLIIWCPWIIQGIINCCFGLCLIFWWWNLNFLSLGFYWNINFMDIVFNNL